MMRLTLLLLAACVDTVEPTCVQILDDSAISQLGADELVLKDDGSEPLDAGDFYTCPGSLHVTGAARLSLDGRKIAVRTPSGVCRLVPMDERRPFVSEVCS